jgi:hypothetical protein
VSADSRRRGQKERVKLGILFAPGRYEYIIFVLNARLNRATWTQMNGQDANLWRVRVCIMHLWLWKANIAAGICRSSARTHTSANLSALRRENQVTRGETSPRLSVTRFAGLLRFALALRIVYESLLPASETLVEESHQRSLHPEYQGTYRQCSSRRHNEQGKRATHVKTTHGNRYRPMIA